ncbi:MAG TPA: hypothetical protein VK864_03830 [Longimicrobiales bacterium]|nr:hypothetical protein [Longimicrobiales bacterium]
MKPQSINQVLAQHTDALMAVPGVVGTAIGGRADHLHIVVLIAEFTPAVDQLPRTLAGYEVKVEVSGRFRARRSHS